MMWLKQGIASRRLIINDAKALVHSVNDTAYLVSPGVFQRYVQEHPHVGTLARQDKMPDWQWVQKRFEKLGLHRKHDSGLNIWICEVTGPRKSRKLHGYLLIDANWLFDAVPPNNPYLRVTLREFSVAYPHYTNYTTGYPLFFSIYNNAADMQQQLFQPPDVSGWPSYYQEPMHYELWVNSNSLPKYHLC